MKQIIASIVLLLSFQLQAMDSKEAKETTQATSNQATTHSTDPERIAEEQRIHTALGRAFKSFNIDPKKISISIVDNGQTCISNTINKFIKIPRNYGKQEESHRLEHAVYHEMAHHYNQANQKINQEMALFDQKKQNIEQSSYLMSCINRAQLLAHNLAVEHLIHDGAFDAVLYFLSNRLGGIAAGQISISNQHATLEVEAQNIIQKLDELGYKIELSYNPKDLQKARETTHCNFEPKTVVFLMQDNKVIHWNALPLVLKLPSFISSEQKTSSNSSSGSSSVAPVTSTTESYGKETKENVQETSTSSSPTLLSEDERKIYNAVNCALESFKVDPNSVKIVICDEEKDSLIQNPNTIFIMRNLSKKVAVLKFIAYNQVAHLFDLQLGLEHDEFAAENLVIKQLIEEKKYPVLLSGIMTLIMAHLRKQDHIIQSVHSVQKEIENMIQTLKKFGYTIAISYPQKNNVPVTHINLMYGPEGILAAEIPNIVKIGIPGIEEKKEQAPSKITTSSSSSTAIAPSVKIAASTKQPSRMTRSRSFSSLSNTYLNDILMKIYPLVINRLGTFLKENQAQHALQREQIFAQVLNHKIQATSSTGIISELLNLIWDQTIKNSYEPQKHSQLKEQLEILLFQAVIESFTAKPLDSKPQALLENKDFSRSPSSTIMNNDWLNFIGYKEGQIAASQLKISTDDCKVYEAAYQALKSFGIKNLRTVIIKIGDTPELSFTDPITRTITLCRTDLYEAQIFTAYHEVAHLVDLENTPVQYIRTGDHHHTKFELVADKLAVSHLVSEKNYGPILFIFFQTLSLTSLGINRMCEAHPLLEEEIKNIEQALLAFGYTIKISPKQMRNIKYLEISLVDNNHIIYAGQYPIIPGLNTHYFEQAESKTITSNSWSSAFSSSSTPSTTITISEYKTEAKINSQETAADTSLGTATAPSPNSSTWTEEDEQIYGPQNTTTIQQAAPTSSTTTMAATIAAIASIYAQKS